MVKTVLIGGIKPKSLSEGAGLQSEDSTLTPESMLESASRVVPGRASR